MKTTAKITPLTAIRKHCVECFNGAAREVKHCPSGNCPLFLLRSGRRIIGISRLKAIKAMCLECAGHVYKEVYECPRKACFLYQYRLGSNPALKGRGSPEKAAHARESVAGQGIKTSQG